MLAQSSKSDYNPIDNRLLLFVILQCALINLGAAYLDVYKCLLVLNGITIVSIAYYNYTLIWELSSLLEIRVFKIKMRKQQSLLTTA